MALHIFAYNLHLKVSHAVCNNHFNKVPLTVNIHICAKDVGVMGISIQKHMGAHCCHFQAVWRNQGFFFYIISSLGYFLQKTKRSLKIRAPALRTPYVFKTVKLFQYSKTYPKVWAHTTWYECHCQSGCPDVTFISGTSAVPDLNLNGSWKSDAWEGLRLLYFLSSM